MFSLALHCMCYGADVPLGSLALLSICSEVDWHTQEGAILLTAALTHEDIGQMTIIT